MLQEKLKDNFDFGDHQLKEDQKTTTAESKPKVE
jgi:hypothetical protein